METVEQVQLGPNPNHPKRVTPQTLRLQHDYVLVRPLAPPVKKAGALMFMPESAGERERNSRGVVLAVGPGDYNQMGTTRLPMGVEVDDLVFFGKYAGTEEEFDGQRLLCMREVEIRLTVPAGHYELVEHEDPRLYHLAEDWCDVCYGDPEAEAKTRLEEAREQLRDEVSPLRTVEEKILRRPCAEPNCLGMQTLVAGSNSKGNWWNGTRCGHTHPAELEP